MAFSAAIQARIGADVSDLQAKGAQVEGIAGKMNSALSNIGVGLSFGIFAAFFSKVVENAGKIQDLSDRLNVSTDALQAFTYQARLAGADSAEVTQVWDKAQKSISQLAAGEERAIEVFSRLGLKQRDLLGIPLEEQVEKIAKAYSAAKEKAGAYDAVTDILGTKSAPKLMAVLQQLADQGLPGFVEGARAAGQVIKSDTIERIDELGDRFQILKESIVTSASQTLDLVLKSGQYIGYGAAGIYNSFKGIQTSWDITADKAVKSAGEQVAAMTKVMAKADVLKRMDSAQFDRITSLLPVKQRIIAMEEQALKLRLEAVKAGKGTVEWAEKEERARKLFFEAEKMITEEKRKQGLTASEQLEVSRLQVKIVAGTLTQAERARLDILNLQVKQLGIQADLAPLMEKGYSNLSREEKIKFDHLVQSIDELTKQIGLKQQIIDKTKSEGVAEVEVGTKIQSNTELWEKFVGTINSVGRGDKELSDRELDRKIQNLRGQVLQAGLQDQRGGYDWRGMNYNLLGEAAKGYLDQALAEQRFRGDVRQAVRSFGEDRAFQMYDGLTERRLKEIIGSLNDSEKLVKGLEQLRDSQQDGLAKIAETLKAGGGR